MKRIGVWETDTNEFIRSVIVNGNYLYVMLATYLLDESTLVAGPLKVIDISTPSSPEVIATITEVFDSVSSPELFAHYGNYLFFRIADKLGIMDISNIESPEWISVIDTVGHIRQVCAYSDGVDTYVVCGSGGVDDMTELRIINITDPESPELYWRYVPEEIPTDPPDIDLTEHNIGEIELKYPYLFLIERKNLEDDYEEYPWDPYTQWGYIQIRKFDLTDLSSPPIEWLSSDRGARIEGIASAISDNYLPIRFQEHHTTFGDNYYRCYLIVLSFSDSVFICEWEDYFLFYWPIQASGDTFFLRSETRIIGLRFNDCDIETLGYYAVESPKFTLSRDTIYDWNNHKISIITWIPGQIGDQGSLERKTDYRVYPSPIFSGNKMVLNETIDKTCNIIDISGRRMDKIFPGTREIDVDNYPAGVYFLVSQDKKVKIKFLVM